MAPQEPKMPLHRYRGVIVPKPGTEAEHSSTVEAFTAAGLPAYVSMDVLADTEAEARTAIQNCVSKDDTIASITELPMEREQYAVGIDTLLGTGIREITAYTGNQARKIVEGEIAMGMAPGVVEGVRWTLPKAEYEALTAAGLISAIEDWPTGPN